MNEKEFLYVGFYIDTDNKYILKIGTTNNLQRRAQEHTRNYHKANQYRMPSESHFEYLWSHKLSKYNTLRYEDLNRQLWQDQKIGDFVRNDRFVLKEKPNRINIKIRKIYEININ